MLARALLAQSGQLLRCAARRSIYSAAAAQTEFDLVVIGGGSGGLAAAHEAAARGASVAVCDFVEPGATEQGGTRWGLGGSCVNVGCIPKKIMHDCFGGARSLGLPPPRWEEVSQRVRAYVASLNFGERKALAQDGITYFNEYASLAAGGDGRTVRAGGAELRARRGVLLATGCRPTLPGDLQGAERCITSDDFFQGARLASGPPGRTLVVGASYVALECAGIVHAAGYPVTVAPRSILLRGFDRQMAELVGFAMQRDGVRMLNPRRERPVAVGADGVVQFSSGREEPFDTVLLATGRAPPAHWRSALGLDAAGVEVHPESGRICVDAAGRTSNERVFAVGDIAHGRPELTPAAIRAGVSVAQRLFPAADRHEVPDIDFAGVPVTVYTHPLEYSCVGLSEEQVEDAEAIDVYHSNFTRVEWSTVLRETASDSGGGGGGGSLPAAYAKMLVERDGGRLVGAHFAGSHAGEVMQGFATAMAAGATLGDVQRTLAIHPTGAEVFQNMRFTKRSGVDVSQTSC